MKMQMQRIKSKVAEKHEERPLEIYKNSSTPQIYFISEFSPSDTFHRMVRSRFPDLQYAVYRPFPFAVNMKTFKRGVGPIYIKESADFSKIVPVNSKILPMGRALNAITKDSSVNTEGFYDTEFNNSRFYDPNTKSWIYPVDSSLEFVIGTRPLDNFNRHFFYSQIERAMSAMDYPLPQDNVELINVEDTTAFLKEHIGKKEAVAWDLETSGFNFQRDRIICITMSFDGRTGYYLDWNSIDKELLNEFFIDKYQIGANLKFDIKFVRFQGVTNATVHFDTLNAGHVLNELRSNSLKTHAWVYTQHGGYDLPLEKYKLDNPKNKSYEFFPKSMLFQYATMDSIVTYKVYLAMRKHLSEDPLLERYFYEDVMPPLRFFPEIEMIGMKVNWQTVENIYPELNDNFNKLNAELDEAFGMKPGEMNWNSGEQVGRLLEKKGWEPLEIAKKGYYKSNKDLMVEWEKLGHTEASIFLKRSQIKGVLKNFIGKESENTGIWQYRGVDDAVHPSYMFMLAQSHRLKSSNPNAQNYPKNSTYAKLIRKMFDAYTKDYYISEGDYAGLQLRVATVLSDDPSLRKIFLELGGDMHSMTGHSVFARNPIDLIRVEDNEGNIIEMPADTKVKVMQGKDLVEKALSDVQVGEEVMNL